MVIRPLIPSPGGDERWCVAQLLPHNGLRSLSERVLVDGNLVHSSGLASISGGQIAFGVSEHQGLVVVGIGHFHRDLGVDVLVLRHGAASLVLLFDGSAPAETVAGS